MRSEWQRLLRAPLSGEPLRFEGTRSGNKPASHDGEEADWVDGNLISQRGRRVARVTGGIADFVETPSWGDAEIESMGKESWAERNWANQGASLLEAPAFRELAELIAGAGGSAGGLILETAAGPGGGNMPMTLALNPVARILVNDVEIRILAEWRRFLVARSLGPEVSFACFDACDIPLCSDSVDCVSSLGGFMSVLHRELALKEALRVLRPGGLLAATEAVLLKPPLSVLKLTMPEIRPYLAPGLETGWIDLLDSIGFTVLRDTAGSRKTMDPDDGEIGRGASRAGVQAELQFHHIVARK